MRAPPTRFRPAASPDARTGLPGGTASSYPSKMAAAWAWPASIDDGPQATPPPRRPRAAASVLVVAAGGRHGDVPPLLVLPKLLGRHRRPGLGHRALEIVDGHLLVLAAFQLPVLGAPLGP